MAPLISDALFRIQSVADHFISVKINRLNTGNKKSSVT